MWERFAGFHKPSEAAIKALWKDAVFVFDASVLLDIYRVAGVYGELVALKEHIKERIFVPHQFAMEFHRNLDGELRKVEQRNANAASVLQRAKNAFIDEIYKGANPTLPAKVLRDDIDAAVNKYSEDLKAELAGIQAKLASSFNEIRTFLDELLSGKIGRYYERERLWTLYEEGRRRYASFIPPGFEDVHDKSTDERQFGDFIGWMQMLDYVKENRKPIIFVTEDTKQDWWLSAKSDQPHPYLVQEMAEVGSQPYYQYNLRRFLQRAATEFESAQPNEELLQNLDVERETQEDARIRRLVFELAKRRAVTRAVPALSTYELTQKLMEDRRLNDDLLNYMGSEYSKYTSMYNDDLIARIMRSGYGPLKVTRATPLVQSEEEELREDHVLGEIDASDHDEDGDE